MLVPVYGHIKANRRRTFLLFFSFALLFLAAGYALGVFMESIAAGLVVAGIIAVIVFLISYYSGQNIVTAMAGAKPVRREEEPYLYHTVEGLSIAAGIPTPKAYIIETDTPNAFAAGRNPKTAIVAVTRGLLNRLNRVELEGVIAHELAHINNYDILIATMAIVLAGTIVFISEMSRRSLWLGRGVGGRGGRNSQKSQGLIIIVVVLLAILAPIFARILQFAISREREYLADASAAELTGYPEGLAGALEKISGMQAPDGPLNKQALQGLFIVNPAFTPGARLSAGQLFTTHPPIEKRVQRLREM